MNSIEVFNLSKKFGKFISVNDISFEVTEGEVLGFLGGNGAGKSTTIKMLCGILEPTASARTNSVRCGGSSSHHPPPANPNDVILNYFWRTPDCDRAWCRRRIKATIGLDGRRWNVLLHVPDPCAGARRLYTPGTLHISCKNRSGTTGRWKLQGRNSTSGSPDNRELSYQLRAKPSGTQEHRTA